MGVEEGGEKGDRWSSLLGTVVGGPLTTEAAAAAAFAFMNSSKRRRLATKWTREEDERVQTLVKLHGTRSWMLVSRQLPGRNPKQVRRLCLRASVTLCREADKRVDSLGLHVQ